ncbi:hypothetical protein [Mesonia aquimarina]|uniref:hypothetical protein n=1 Tax=Mesonia aquimarina TaxID=1504967 RepID=UPI000EF5A972|nr:hypothetical protein [Mesonia aquimarina]
MKKTICISSEDEAVDKMATSLKILSEFKNRGFTSRASFVNVVAEMNEKYKDYRKARQLEFFWIMRVHNDNLNNDLTDILEQLKAE